MNGRGLDDQGRVDMTETTEGQQYPLTRRTAPPEDYVPGCETVSMSGHIFYRDTDWTLKQPRYVHNLYFTCPACQPEAR